MYADLHEKHILENNIKHKYFKNYITEDFLARSFQSHFDRSDANGLVLKDWDLPQR